METPFGEIPEKFIKDMSTQDMYEYTKVRYSRRRFLQGAAAAGALAVAGPVFWRQSTASASSTGSATGPQWIAYGPDSSREMWISWNAGNASTPASVPRPLVRYGPRSDYGSVVLASSGHVPTPPGAPSEELTSYQHALLTDLRPDTEYHYSVSNDGKSWGPDTTFRTGKTGLVDFRFCATGDENSFSTSSGPIMQSITSFDPDFTLVSGDLSYASDDGTYFGVGTPLAYTPSAWDSYFAVLGSSGGQSIPWMVGPGNHDVEPFADNGFGGLVTRFPHFGPNAANAGSGSQVVQSFTYSNVAIIGLDDSDVSTLDTVNNGYTGGKQTSWFIGELEKYRAADSGVDFVVVFFHHCPFCSGGPGSDGGDRTVWQPIFDRYNVDLVINGHNHLYERVYPMIGGVVQAEVPSGGTVDSSKAGTTYICTGGGGQSLAATDSSGWFGPSAGGAETGLSGSSIIAEYSGGETATGGTGTVHTGEPDPTSGWSAYRRGQFCHLVIDVTAPTTRGGTTTMLIRAIDPTQTGATTGPITSITPPENVMDSITLVRKSVAHPGHRGPRGDRGADRGGERHHQQRRGVRAAQQTVAFN